MDNEWDLETILSELLRNNEVPAGTTVDQIEIVPFENIEGTINQQQLLNRQQRSPAALDIMQDLPETPPMGGDGQMDMLMKALMGKTSP